MPIKEALFWFGLATYETGLWFSLTPEQRILGFSLLLLGLLLSVASILIHYKPQMKKPPVWMLLFFINVAALAYDIYDRHRSASPAQFNIPIWGYLAAV